MKLAIVVGHSPKSPGAKNNEVPITEYELNEELALNIQQICIKRDISSIVAYRKNGYSKLPEDINRLDPEYCICIHHNGASDKSIDGTETLYYHKSSKSNKFAHRVNGKMVLVQEKRNRGAKGIDSEDRGGYVLKYTNMPCILIEPYFMTNTEAVKERDSKKLAEAIVDGFEEFLTKS